jgi:hypothetical protein
VIAPSDNSLSQPSDKYYNENGPIRKCNFVVLVSVFNVSRLEIGLENSFNEKGVAGQCNSFLVLKRVNLESLNM